MGIRININMFPFVDDDRVVKLIRFISTNPSLMLQYV